MKKKLKGMALALFAGSMILATVSKDFTAEAKKGSEVKISEGEILKLNKFQKIISISNDKVVKVLKNGGIKALKKGKCLIKYKKSSQNKCVKIIVQKKKKNKVGGNKNKSLKKRVDKSIVTAAPAPTPVPSPTASPVASASPAPTAEIKPSPTPWGAGFYKGLVVSKIETADDKISNVYMIPDVNAEQASFYADKGIESVLVNMTNESIKNISAGDKVYLIYGLTSDIEIAIKEGVLTISNCRIIKDGEAFMMEVFI